MNQYTNAERSSQPFRHNCHSCGRLSTSEADLHAHRCEPEAVKRTSFLRWGRSFSLTRWAAFYWRYNVAAGASFMEDHRLGDIRFYGFGVGPFAFGIFLRFRGRAVLAKETAK